MKTIKPNFLFIGPDKTGSSWLYTILRQHNQCYIPVAKETWFFDKYYYRGLKWYLSFFKNAPANSIAIGELSHNYLFSPLVASRIAKEFPNIKLITCLRDPAKRSFSQYLYMVRSGITNLSFEDAVEKYPEIINHSLYYKHLSNYFRYFPRQNINVLWFSRLIKEPREFARDLFQFLGINDNLDIDYGKKVRVAGKARCFKVANILNKTSRIFRDIGFANLIGIVKHSWLMHIFYKEYSNDDKPKLPMEMEIKLRNIFLNDVMALQKLLNVDLSHWIIQSGKEE